MGIKRNILVPFSYYFSTNNLRSDYFKKVNKYSFKKYFYLLGKTLSSAFDQRDLTNLNQGLRFVLSDHCLMFRKYPYINRLFKSLPLDIDSSISSFDVNYFFFDYRNRSHSFMIANPRNFLNPEFLIHLLKILDLKIQGFLIGNLGGLKNISYV